MQSRDDLRKRYLQQGYLLSPEPIYTREQCAQLRARFDRMFSEANASNMRNLNLSSGESESEAAHPSKGAFFQITDYSKRDQLLKAHLANPKLLDLVELCIGPDIQYMEEAAYNLPPRVGKGICWHQDNGYYRAKDPKQVTTWTPLDDVNEENGCIWIVPGSHKGLVPHRPLGTSDRLLEAQNVDESTAMPVIMQAGSVLLFDCQLLHRSRDNRSDRPRRVLNIAYMQTNSVIPGWELSEETHPVFRGRTLAQCAARGA